MTYSGGAIDSIRVLSGVMASETMDKEVKEKAKAVLIKLISSIEKSTDMEMKMLSEASAKMNGIIS